jgi:small subunit ribosomal protein S20
MPIKAAAFKALRKAGKNASRNLLAKLQIRDVRRSVRKALEAKNIKAAGEAAKRAIRLLDKAYSRGIMKLGTVSRHKSRLVKAVQAIARDK